MHDSQDNPDGRWADDLSWIVGRLRHEALEGGFWRLEFGGADAPAGGSVVLGRSPQLQGAGDGDLVRVTGHPDEFGATVFMAGIPYELATLERVIS